MIDSKMTDILKGFDKVITPQKDKPLTEVTPAKQPITDNKAMKSLLEGLDSAQSSVNQMPAQHKMAKNTATKHPASKYLVGGEFDDEEDLNPNNPFRNVDDNERRGDEPNADELDHRWDQENMTGVVTAKLKDVMQDDDIEETLSPKQSFKDLFKSMSETDEDMETRFKRELRGDKTKPALKQNDKGTFNLSEKEAPTGTWKQTSWSPEEAKIKFGEKNVRVTKAKLNNGDDMVEVYVETTLSEEHLDENDYDQYEGHGWSGSDWHEPLKNMDAYIDKHGLSPESIMQAANNEAEAWSGPMGYRGDWTAAAQSLKDAWVRMSKRGQQLSQMFAQKESIGEDADAGYFELVSLIKNLTRFSSSNADIAEEFKVNNGETFVAIARKIVQAVKEIRSEAGVQEDGASEVKTKDTRTSQLIKLARNQYSGKADDDLSAVANMLHDKDIEHDSEIGGLDVHNTAQDTDIDVEQNVNDTQADLLNNILDRLQQLEK